MYLTENGWVYNSKTYSRVYQCLNRNRILSSEEKETTSKTELRFNCHVKASMLIYSCFILWICFSYTVTLEYTISEDKCVQKRVSDLCWDELHSTIVLVLLYINPKKQKNTCGLVCVALQFLISVTSPASKQCCIEWPYTCHQFEQESFLEICSTLMSWLLVQRAAHTWIKTLDKCLMLPFATVRLWIVSLIRRLCLFNLKPEKQLDYLYICKYLVLFPWRQKLLNWMFLLTLVIFYIQ